MISTLCTLRRAPPASLPGSRVRYQFEDRIGGFEAEQIGRQRHDKRVARSSCRNRSEAECWRNMVEAPRAPNSCRGTLPMASMTGLASAALPIRALRKSSRRRLPRAPAGAMLRSAPCSSCRPVRRHHISLADLQLLSWSVSCHVLEPGSPHDRDFHDVRDPRAGTGASRWPGTLELRRLRIGDGDDRQGEGGSRSRSSLSHCNIGAPQASYRAATEEMVTIDLVASRRNAGETGRRSSFLAETPRR